MQLLGTGAPPFSFRVQQSPHSWAWHSGSLPPGTGHQGPGLALGTWQTHPTEEPGKPRCHTQDNMSLFPPTADSSWDTEVSQHPRRPMRGGPAGPRERSAGPGPPCPQPQAHWSLQALGPQQMAAQTKAPRVGRVRREVTVGPATLTPGDSVVCMVCMACGLHACEIPRVSVPRGLRP